MPKLGESVTEGTVNTWLVQVGDHVNKYDPIAEVLTDKVNAEVPSSFTGTITEIVADAGDTILVGETMCYIETSETEETNTSNEPEENNEQTDFAEKDTTSMKNRYSPAVARLAQENDIDLTKVTGSGRDGRITRKDIKKIIHQIEEQSTNSESMETKDESVNQMIRNEHTSPENTEDTIIPVRGIRKTVANHMIRSKDEIPHAWMQIEVDVTDLVTYRNKIKTSFKQQEGFNLTFFPFFIKAVAIALKKYPQLNSTWAGDHIIQRKETHISIAVANEDELLVPVIKNADEKSIKGIAKDIHELVHKAKSGSLALQDMEGGTFTVNNTGTFGSISSMGIINYPQAALLQVETIVKKPVIIDNMFAARDMINLSLSLDHRVLDGLICGRFLAYVKEILENMNEQTEYIY
jgi:2-oxoisovalerate dehydrogenase E2 component (dihydrolipoyl transacylase)